MAVLDWLQQLLGGGDPEAEGAAQASAAMQPMTQPWLDKVLSGEMARSGIQDVNDAFASRDPVALAGSFGPSPLGIRAWHASPYDFDKFDISKVGTGQGAASYGHGIYAAENPRVSGPGGSYDLEFTAKNLGKYDLNQGEQEVLRVLRAGGSDMDALGSLARGGGYTFDEAQQVLDRVKAAKAKLYEVDINADPNAFLNWDKPLSQQARRVEEVIADLSVERKIPMGNATGARAYDDLSRPPYGTPGHGLNDPRGLSETLSQRGIPGIRYLDEGSRFNPASLPDNAIANEARGFLQIANGDSVAALKAFQESNPISRWGASERDEVRKVIEAAARPQTSNYVMFDDKLIDIRRKLGLLPPVAAAGGLLAAPGPGETTPP